MTKPLLIEEDPNLLYYLHRKAPDYRFHFSEDTSKEQWFRITYSPNTENTEDN